jgi:putative Holliday junction resolvase
VSRILAVDWGTKRIGLALSDPTRLLARSLPTAVVRGAAEAERRVEQAARREGAETILIGLPLHMEGEEGSSARGARRLGEALARKGFEVHYRDERLTTEEALDFLRSRGETRPDKTRIDQVAALILLQEYLDELRERERA